MKPEEWILLVRTLSIITAVIVLLATTACTTVDGYTWITPIPCDNCNHTPQVSQGVTQETVTISGKTYQIIRAR